MREDDDVVLIEYLFINRSSVSLESTNILIIIVFVLSLLSLIKLTGPETDVDLITPIPFEACKSLFNKI